MIPSPQFDPRDEYEWESTLKESDAYASRYFELLRRFSDLPDADSLICHHLENEFSEAMGQCDFDCENCAQQWHCDMVPDDDSRGSFGPEDFLDELMNDEEDESGEDAREVRPGDALFYEAHPAFQLLQHCAFGWCNIYAAVLSPEGRRTGLCVLYYLGRALAHLASSIGDGLYENPSASAAFAKRSLAQCNQALGEMKKMGGDRPQYGQLLSAMRQHILKARSTIFDHFQTCRSHASRN